MNRHIEIPKRLLDKLSNSRGEKDWLIKVEQVNQNIADYFYRTPYFFPEYTDHGVLHIQKVLDICNKLIPDNSLGELSPKEVGVLIISIMIHDIGMFIHKDGVIELIYGSLKKTKIEFLDTDTWEQVWKDYVLSVKRYSDKKLMRIFGNSEPIQFGDIQMDNLREQDILLYGDFLRQNHGRLAHTIVKEGFLGKETIDIFRNVNLDESIKDIIGLIARSHCIPLRDCREFLNNSFLDTPLYKFYRKNAV